MFSSPKTVDINLRNWKICRHSVCNAVAEQYPGYFFEERVSDKQYFRSIVRGVNNENIVQESIGRNTVRRGANLYEAYIAKLLLHVRHDCTTSKNVLSVVVRLGQRTYRNKTNYQLTLKTGLNYQKWIE